MMQDEWPDGLRGLPTSLDEAKKHIARLTEERDALKHELKTLKEHTIAAILNALNVGDMPTERPDE